MEDSSPAQKHYESVRRATKSYYERNREKILEKAKESYRQKHPQGGRRGRPRKEESV
jgi:hypothetical protein